MLKKTFLFGLTAFFLLICHLFASPDFGITDIQLNPGSSNLEKKLCLVTDVVTHATVSEFANRSVKGHKWIGTIMGIVSALHDKCLDRYGINYALPVFSGIFAGGSGYFLSFVLTKIFSIESPQIPLLFGIGFGIATTVFERYTTYHEVLTILNEMISLSSTSCFFFVLLAIFSPPFILMSVINHAFNLGLSFETQCLSLTLLLMCRTTGLSPSKIFWSHN